MLPYVQIYNARGKPFAYYRRAGTRVRLPGVPGSAEFLVAYQIAHDGFVKTERALPPDVLPGSFLALWRGYEASPEFKQIAIETQKDYRRLIEPLTARFGSRAVANMDRAWVIGRRDELAETPRKANKLVAVLRLLVFWGMDRGYQPRNGNPALRIGLLRTGQGWRAWTDAEIVAMTSPAAAEVAFEVLMGLYTAQREHDLLAAPWSAWDGRTITVTQRKSRHQEKQVTVTIPVHPVLAKALRAKKRAMKAQKTPAITICTRPDGQPWSIHHFKHRLAAVRDDLGLSKGVVFHGLRHSAASRLAEAGCTDAEIQAITGHKTRAMIGKYTAGARQKTLAKSAIARLPTARIKNKTV